MQYDLHILNEVLCVVPHCFLKTNIAAWAFDLDYAIDKVMCENGDDSEDDSEDGAKEALVKVKSEEQVDVLPDTIHNIDVVDTTPCGELEATIPPESGHHNKDNLVQMISTEQLKPMSTHTEKQDSMSQSLATLTEEESTSSITPAVYDSVFDSLKFYVKRCVQPSRRKRGQPEPEQAVADDIRKEVESAITQDIRKVSEPAITQDIEIHDDHEMEEGELEPTSSYHQQFIGKQIIRIFNSFTYRGEVVSYCTKEEKFTISYIDNDSELMTISELQECLSLYEQQKDNVYDALDTSIKLRERKSDKSRSQISTDFMNYLGRCREKSENFSWELDGESKIDLSNMIHFEREMGRAYFKRFIMNETKCKYF